jgi:hypothetical protein
MISDTKHIVNIFAVKWAGQQPVEAAVRGIIEATRRRLSQKPYRRYGKDDAGEKPRGRDRKKRPGTDQ